MSKLTGEQWLMNGWYEFLTLLESRNMLMNSGRKPSICKVMTKVVMKYSWLACLCLEAQQFIAVYIQHLWPRSGSPLHVWMIVGAWECYKHHCKTRTPRKTGALLHREHAPSEGSWDLGMCKGFTPLPSCWEEDYSLEIQALDKQQRREGKIYVKEHSFYIANVHMQLLTGINKSWPLLLGHLWKQDFGSLKHFWTHCLLLRPVLESSPCPDFCGVSLDMHKDKYDQDIPQAVFLQ